MLGACDEPRPPPPAPPTPSTATAGGCDRARLGEVLEQLGAARVRHERFRGAVPVGAPVSVALRRCREGEPFAECEARHRAGSSRGGFVQVDGRTEVRFAFERRAAETELGRRLEALGEDDPTLELGRRTQTRVLTDPRVCVRGWETERVRLPEATASDLVFAHRLRFEGEGDDLAWGADARGALTVRCRARHEARPGPLEGACAPIADAALARATTRCDEPLPTAVRLRHGEDGPRIYGISPTGLLGGRIGLQNGDGLVSACGNAIASRADLERVIGEGRCALVVSRGGEAVRISLEEACGEASEPAQGEAR